MKCEYCGNKYKAGKYGDYCHCCYAPAPKHEWRPRDYGYTLSNACLDGHDVAVCSTTYNASYVIGGK